MLSREELDKKIRALPEPVQDYIFDEERAVWNDKVIDGTGMDDDEVPILLRLENELFVKEVTLTGLEAQVRERFGYGAEKAKALALAIAGYQLLPLDTYLGDVDGYIHSLGGDPSVYPDLRIVVEERTTEEAVQDVVGTNAESVSHRIRTRLHDVIKSFLAGIRTEEQLYEILTRSEKIGGVGLSADVARKIVSDTKEEKRTVSINDDKPASERKKPIPAPKIVASVPDDAAQAPPPPPPPPKKPADTFVTILPEDEEEIEAIRKNLPAETVAKSKNTDQKIKASVEELYLASGIIPPTDELKARLKKIIENRLRDIRDQLETLEALAQPKELGGMSLSQTDARRVISLIENKLKSVHSMHEKVVAAEKRKWVESEAVHAIKRVEDEKAEEEKKREEAFRSVVAKSKKAQKVVGGVPPKPAPKLPPAPGQPPAKLPVIPKAKAPIPAPPPQPVPKPRPAKPPATIVRPAIRPPVPKPIMRPKVQDVKFAPKLTGPFEEIQKTTLEDFRRLSKDPKEAALKIKDKIDLQAEESFDNKTKAISAWNTSEVYKVYLEMMKEALEGKPMEQVIAARNEAKKPALTQEEMNAIVDLGIKLRY